MAPLKKDQDCKPCTQRANLLAEVMIREATLEGRRKDADIRTKSHHNGDS